MKEKIIRKSEELFLTLGFKSITMDDIANAMGISKKTIYAHFTNKTELVEVVTFEALNQIHLGIDKIRETSTNPIEELYQTKMFIMTYLKNEKVSPQFQLKKYYPKTYDLLNIKQFEKMNSCVMDSNTFFTQQLHLKAKYKVKSHEGVKLYTVRHYNDAAVEDIENGKEILLKQVSPEIMQLITT